jgi:hypothetical protein
MDITTFDDLLTAARAQPQPQRLLFVFAGIELPDDATVAQRENFERGEGGALVPQMCVDKAPEELASFADLVEEARSFGPAWGMVFAAALSGAAGRAPTSEDASEPLERMVESIKQGHLSGFIPFDTQGHTVRLG